MRPKKETTWNVNAYPMLSIDMSYQGLRRSAKGVPMNRSGISLDKASHARYIDPRLCPKRVKRGQVESSTR